MVLPALLSLAACSGGASSPPTASEADSGATFSVDDGSPDAVDSALEAGSGDTFVTPTCTSIPSGPTGTVSTQGDVGFAIAGGGAWQDQGELGHPDGGWTPTSGLFVQLSDQANACVVGGDYVTGISKANVHYLAFDIEVAGDQPPGPGTYTITPDDGGVAALTVDLGYVLPGCNGQLGTTLPPGAPQGSVTLTEVTPDHVKGTYSLDLESHVSGTFDVPMCPPVQIPQPCCVP